MRLDDHVTADLRRGSCSAEKFWVFDVKWEPPTLIALLGQSKHKFSPPSKPRWIHSGADKTSSQVGAEKVCFCSSTEVRSGGDGVGGQIVRDEETGVGLYIVLWMNDTISVCTLITTLLHKILPTSGEPAISITSFGYLIILIALSIISVHYRKTLHSRKSNTNILLVLIEMIWSVFILMLSQISYLENSKLFRQESRNLSLTISWTRTKP